MSSARDILDERLARGEISADEHAALTARLGTGAASGSPVDRISPAAGNKTKTTMTIMWNAFGIAIAAAWMVFTNQIVQNLIRDCIDRGGLPASCQANTIKWPLVFASNSLSVLVGVVCVLSIIAATKRA